MPPENSNSNEGAITRGEPELAHERAQRLEVEGGDHANGTDQLVADPANPSPQQNADAPPPPPEDEPADRTMPTRAPDPRADIYNRFKRRTNDQQEEITRDTSTDPLFARPRPDPEDEIDEGDPDLQPMVTEMAKAGQPPKAPAAPAPPAAPASTETLTLKVNHQLYTVTRAQAAEMAGLSPEDAKSLSIDTLRRVAQIEEANRQRTTRAEAQPSATPQAPAATQTQSNAPPEAEYDLDKVLLGDPDEAKAEFAKAARAEARKLLDEDKQRDRAVTTAKTIETAIRDLTARAPDLLADEDHSTFLLGKSADFMVEALGTLGIPKDKLAQMRANPAEVTKFYKAAIEEGYEVPTPQTILQRAEDHTRKVFNRPKPGTSPAAPAQTTQQTQQPASTTRQEMKRALPQPTQRSGTDVRQPVSDPALASRSSAIDKMRAARGQTPLR